MKFLRKAMLLLLFPLVAFSGMHKFYLSVTQVNYSQEEESFQITSRIFIDDFDAVLQERYGVVAELATPSESGLADVYIEKYFRSKFVLRINGKATAYTYLGKQYDNDMLVCYFELSGIPLDSISSIEVQNEILTDMFDEQKNIVHVVIKDLKRSFVLLKENNKGMLNF